MSLSTVDSHYSPVLSTCHKDGAVEELQHLHTCTLTSGVKPRPSPWYSTSYGYKQICSEAQISAIFGCEQLTLDNKQRCAPSVQLAQWTSVQRGNIHLIHGYLGFIQSGRLHFHRTLKGFLKESTYHCHTGEFNTSSHVTDTAAPIMTCITGQPLLQGRNMAPFYILGLLTRAPRDRPAAPRMITRCFQIACLDMTSHLCAHTHSQAHGNLACTILVLISSRLQTARSIMITKLRAES